MASRFFLIIFLSFIVKVLIASPANYKSFDSKKIYNDSIKKKGLEILEMPRSHYIDSVWLTGHEYFHTWDTLNVDPYYFDVKNFNDTIPLMLFDSSKSWSKPLRQAIINSKFGYRRYRWHKGVDLDLETGDTVRAVFDGIVRISKYNRRGYGNYVMIRHKNGLETLYGHLSKANVHVGDTIKSGQPIGLGGSTGRSSGPHLHFEVRYQGVAIDPLYVFDFKRDGQILGEQLTLTEKHFQYIKELNRVRYHKIKPGDTLYALSRKYGVSVQAICRLNGIRKNTILRVGRKLRVK